MKRETIFERVVRENGHDRERCWIWPGFRDRHGYGKLGVTIEVGGLKKKVKRFAHRHAYEEMRGAIPEGLELDHLCRVHPCMNPWHTEPVTHRVNLLRGKTLITANVAKTHCPHGHEYTPENTYLYLQPKTGRSQRMCHTCRRAWNLIPRKRAKYQRERRARLKAARAA